MARNAVDLKRIQDPIERALGHLLGKKLWDDIVLAGEDDGEGAIERTAAAIEAKADTIASMREGLGLSGEEPDDALPCALDPPPCPSALAPHPSRSPQGTTLNSLCCTAGSHSLSVLHKVAQSYKAS